MEDIITVDNLELDKFFADPMDTSEGGEGRSAPPCPNPSPPEETGSAPPAADLVVAEEVETLQDPGIFRLEDDCSNVPPTGTVAPRVVMYKGVNIIDPLRINLALSFARHWRRVPASVLSGGTADLEELARRGRESLRNQGRLRKREAVKPPEETTEPSEVQPEEAVKAKRPRNRKRPRRTQGKGGARRYPPFHQTPDDRLVARIRALESQLQREKAVAHQGHMEINRLTKELGKEKVENTRLNADLIRIRAERDAFKQQIAKDQEKTPNPGKKPTSLGQRSVVSGLEAQFSGGRVSRAGNENSQHLISGPQPLRQSVSYRTGVPAYQTGAPQGRMQPTAALGRAPAQNLDFGPWL